MKRTTTMLAGLGAAGALFLAGCGGSDTAAPATSAAQSSAAQSSAASSSAVTSAAVTSGSPGSGATTSGSATPAPSSGAGSTSTGAQSSAPVDASTGAVRTVGGDATELDAQSAAWFDAACTSLSPLAGLMTDPADTDDPAAFGAGFVTAGDAMITGAETLQKTPPPTFDGGADIAAETARALAAFGPAVKELGTKASVLDTQDAASVQQFSDELQATFAAAPELAQFDISDSLKPAVAAIPSCAPLFPSS